jgi:hypothetical protein
MLSMIGEVEMCLQQLQSPVCVSPVEKKRGVQNGMVKPTTTRKKAPRLGTQVLQYFRQAMS